MFLRLHILGGIYCPRVCVSRGCVSRGNMFAVDSYIIPFTD